MALLQYHCVIGSEDAIANHVVIKASGFVIDSAENRTLLLVDEGIAAKHSQTVNGCRLNSYTNGVINYLNDLKVTPDYTSAVAGDPAAIARLHEKVRTLSNILKIGLKNGDVFMFPRDAWKPRF